MNKIATGNQHRFAINADKLEAGKIYGCSIGLLTIEATLLPVHTTSL